MGYPFNLVDFALDKQTTFDSWRYSTRYLCSYCIPLPATCAKPLSLTSIATIITLQAFLGRGDGVGVASAGAVVGRGGGRLKGDDGGVDLGNGFLHLDEEGGEVIFVGDDDGRGRGEGCR